MRTGSHHHHHFIATTIHQDDSSIVWSFTGCACVEGTAFNPTPEGYQALIARVRREVTDAFKAEYELSLW